jgi:hypothetical protein
MGEAGKESVLSDTVEFLGFVISPEGIEMYREKISVVLD